jgi:hypothetical protein
VQAKFIMQPNAVRQVVSLLSSASRDIQQSVFDLLVNLSAFEYAASSRQPPAITTDLTCVLGVGWLASTETRKLLVSHQVSVRLTKVLNEAEVFPKILESAIKSTSNIVIEGKPSRLISLLFSQCDHPLMLIALIEENHSALWEDGTVLALVDMLTRPAISAAIKNEVRNWSLWNTHTLVANKWRRVGVPVQIATALQSLSTNKDVRDMIFRANAVPPLVDLMIHNLQDSAEGALEDVLRVMGTHCSPVLACVGCCSRRLTHVPVKNWPVMLTLDEDKQRELRDKHEVDVFFRRIAGANALQELHQMALMGLEYLKAPVDGPLQRRPVQVPSGRF